MNQLEQIKKIYNILSQFTIMVKQIVYCLAIYRDSLAYYEKRL